MVQTTTRTRKQRIESAIAHALARRWELAAAILVFFAFCLQCGSTVAVIGRESGWKWAWFAFAYMTGMAWVGAVLTYQIGSAL